jgi:hypothetical protein
MSATRVMAEPAPEPPANITRLAADVELALLALLAKDGSEHLVCRKEVRGGASIPEQAEV